MGFVNRIVLRNGQTSQRALIEPTLWGVCDTDGSESRKVVSISNFALVQGVMVTVRFTNTNTAVSPTLNINNTGHIGIIYKHGTIATNFLNAGINYSFIYNGTNYELVSVAAQLDVPQTVYVDLANPSTSTTIQGGSTSAEVLGINGILGTGNGGTGSSSHTHNKFVWATSNTTLQASGNHYIDAYKVAINYNSEPEANFFVQGTTIISSDLQNDSTTGEFFKVGNMVSRYLSIGANGLQAYSISNNTVSSGKLDLQPSGGTLQISSAQNTLTAELYGVYNFNTLSGINYKGFAASSNNEYTPIWFSYEGINLNTLALKENTGVPVYSNNLTYNANTHYLRIDNNGGIDSETGTISIKPASHLILESGDSSNIIFKSNSTTLGSFTSSGTFIIGNPATATVNSSGAKLYVVGPTSLVGNVTITGSIIPSGSQGLGSSSSRWSSLLIGTADSYGDAFTPIYWNNGVPTAVSVVQKQAFSLASGESTITLHNAAYNTNTVVLTVVITIGGEYIHAPFRTAVASGTLTLSMTATVTGAVSGYVITARGTELVEGG